MRKWLLKVALMIGALLTLISLGVRNESVSAQAPEGLGLAVSLDVISELIVDSKGIVVGIMPRFYPHEDITVRVYVINHSQQPLPVETPNFDWRQQLRVNLERWKGGVGEPITYRPSKWMSEPARFRLLRAVRQISPPYWKPGEKFVGIPKGILGSEMLAPGEEIVAIVVVTGKDGKRPKPGIYRVAVALGASGEWGRTIEFEVREELTDEDRMNSLYHKAVRARWAKKYKEAETVLIELIALQPNNARFYAEMGAVAEDRGDYQRAIDCYKTAIRLLEEGKDPYARNRR